MLLKMQGVRQIVQRVLLVTSAFTLTACQTVQTTQGGVVGVTRQQNMLASSEEMDASAAKEYAQVLAEQKKKGNLNQNAAQTRRVRNIADRLIAQTAAFRQDAVKWKWEVNVITSTDVNAWCMSGGKIAVYTGLIDSLKITDDELAAVMGHEIAHALREHVRESATEQTVSSSIINIGSALLGAGDIGKQATQFAYMSFFGLPNSREHETEADRIGVELAARAGYDPRAAITLWQKMAKKSDGPQFAFLSTHPSSADRINDLTDYSQRVMPLYESSKKGR